MTRTTKKSQITYKTWEEMNRAELLAAKGNLIDMLSGPKLHEDLAKAIGEQIALVCAQLNSRN